MKRKGKAEEDYVREINGLKTRLEESEETLRAIRNGEVDALVVPRAHGNDIFELKGAEYLYRVFVDTMNEGAATLAPEGTILYCNKRFAEMLDTSPDKVMGSSIYRFMAGGERSGFESAVQKGEWTNSKMEFSFKREDQRLTPVWVSLNALRGQDTPMVCMVVTDLTDRKQAEEKIGLYQNQLRALASELALAEERERKRLAAELHDRIGQNLALAKIKLSGLLHSDDPSGLICPLSEVVEMLEKTIQETHSLIFEISPPVLYQVGFEAAVDWLADHFQEQYGIQIDLKIYKRPKKLREDLRIVLFQAIRELLVNIIKHSQASRAKILMSYQRSDLRILVQDNGLGFAPDEQQGTKKGFGLFYIRERLHHLGGDVQIDSSPGKGTNVTLIIPQPIQGVARREEQNGH